MINILAKLEEITKAGKHATLCIITETSGSTPRKAGSKMIVTESGEVFGTIGGGSVEYRVISEAVKVCGKFHPVKLKFDLEDDLQMQCGGNMEVYIEPINPLRKLVIFGAGHVGSSLARYARDFGFKVIFVDNREDFAKKQSELGFEVIIGDYVDEAGKMEPDINTYVVVVTPKHAFDQEVTGILGQKAFGYLGMIGSKRKVAEAKRFYIENKVLSESAIEKIDMPIGIQFNAQTPEEIAISILARLIDTKNSQTSTNQK